MVILEKLHIFKNLMAKRLATGYAAALSVCLSVPSGSFI